MVGGERVREVEGEGEMWKVRRESMRGEGNEGGRGEKRWNNKKGRDEWGVGSDEGGNKRKGERGRMGERESEGMEEGW